MVAYSAVLWCWRQIHILYLLGKALYVYIYKYTDKAKSFLVFFALRTRGTKYTIKRWHKTQLENSPNPSLAHPNITNRDTHTFYNNLLFSIKFYIKTFKGFTFRGEFARVCTHRCREFFDFFLHSANRTSLIFSLF